MKRMIVGLVLVLAACGGTADEEPVVVSQEGIRPGDILFQNLESDQSLAVRLATGSEWSHCGVVLMGKSGLIVFEAVGPVRRKPLRAWLKQGVDGVYEVRRMRGADSLLTEAVLAKMKAEAEALLGRPYDWVFEWSDSAVYCSELVWKVYDRGAQVQLTPLRQLGDYDLSQPVVQAIVKERYGDDVPVEEPTVAPGDLATSELVTLVNLEK